ncbi:SMC-Scp complex subunit ScpB [Oecophyllibacter saccharovorans]|uniref:SMC-Scp complex subunit ScpB n=1 Tax=Oecophyllibacter saccharovorans TaxID=2558360 RepID=UPI00116D77AD|nr:SMC-Scp complex subunit ScpB [Oecophyllibacter saccharovorans]TPW36643.1 SMC-Scp complex subunit ScpB [Oecophyllibacter saccharovorans]
MQPSARPRSEEEADPATPSPAHPTAPGVRAEAVKLAEALLFASAGPVARQALAEFLAGRGFAREAEGLEEVIAALEGLYAGHAVGVVAVAGGWQLRTRPDYAPALARVVEKPRRLGRAAMETLAVVAYHQPCTRAEIEAIRGVSLGQGVLEPLLEEGLLAPRGRREVPGRPVQWGTTPAFLRLFGLNRLADLPARGELMLDPQPTGPGDPEPEPAPEPESEGGAPGEAAEKQATRTGARSGKKGDGERDV